MATDLSPSVLKVVAALSAGQGLDVASSVIAANTAMYLANIYQYDQSNTDLGNIITSARANLMSMSANIFANGPIGFCTLLSQVAPHVKSAEDLKSAANFISNTSYSSYGSGITSISSMATQGLESTVGNLKSASTAIRLIGPMFDFSDITTVGTGVGFVKRLNQVKLGNYTGVNQQLAAFGIGLNNIDNPIYATTVNAVLGNITSTNTLSTVAEQFKIGVSISNGVVTATSSDNPIRSLNDFINLDVIAPIGSTVGLTANIVTIANKLKDMNAGFESAESAAQMFENLSTPSVPGLDANSSTLGTLVSAITTQLDATTGTGNGPLGTPNLTDFFQTVAGGPEVSALSSNTTITNASILELESAIANSKTLFVAAGIDLNNQSSSFGFIQYLSAATSIRSYGADLENIGVNKILANMVTSDDSGQSITSLMAEGKNTATLQTGGIQPLKFGN